MSAIINGIDIRKVYKTRKVEYEALRGVSFSIEKGEFVALVGPSGSGKTTLLDIIGLLDNPTDGRLIIDGKDVSKLGENERADMRNKKIGFVFQSYNLISYLSTLENVELPLAAAGVPFWKRREKAIQVLSLIPGMLDFKDKRPNELSGGQQQRVAIARALVNDPDIIIADEPTANLDTVTGMAIVNLLKQLSVERNVTVVMATHDPDMIKKCDRIIHIRDGKIEGVETRSGQ
ncbi:peptide ABC transporter ATP-binding protein [Sulfolobales archaeon HS-7]|nr:peptide ABC transporter ATP-binding protein [Sulfolobales archaeon HS-7]